MKTWDEVINVLSEWGKTVATANSLLEDNQPQLACMLLRDRLRTDRNFQFSDEFIGLCLDSNALIEYLCGPEYAAKLLREV